MATDDRCCSIVPYFRIRSGNDDRFREIAERCIAQTREEEGCLYYGFSFDGDEAHCREAYEDADAALVHLGRITPLLQEALEVSDLTRLEVHGPEAELEKLRGPLAGFNPRYFTLESGFRR
jgi:quinol monooxygenase YgiN